MTTKGLMLVISIGVAVVAVAHAQNNAITDSHAWWRQYEKQASPAASSAVADPQEQAIADRIAAVQNAAAQTVVSQHAGHWESHGDGSGARSFSVQLQHNKSSGTLGGHVFVAGSSTLSRGNVSGRVTGAAVSGVVTDDSGAQLVTFTGSVSASGMTGTYQTVDGDTGTWAYDDAAQAGSAATP